MTRVRHVYAVSSPIAGHLARTVLDEGDAVKAGITVVAAIHPLDPPLIDSRSEAELIAARDAARAAVSMAEIDLKRLQSDLQFSRRQPAACAGARQDEFPGPERVAEGEHRRRGPGGADRLGQGRDRVAQGELASAEARLIPPKDPNRRPEASCCIYLTAPVDGVVLRSSPGANSRWRSAPRSPRSAIRRISR